MWRRFPYSKEMTVYALIIMVLAVLVFMFALPRAKVPVVTSARTRPQSTILTEPEKVQTAEETLVKYFSELHDGNYEQAAKHFDGSYAVLQALNDSDPAEDHITLLEDACEINGFACLAISEIEFVKKTDDHHYQFAVVFQNDDGSIYSLEQEDGTETNQFSFTVVEHDDKFFVVQLPLPPS